MTVLFHRAIASLLGCFSITVFVSSSRANPPAICPQDLAPQIEAIVNRPNFVRSRFGVSIQVLGTRQTLYSRDADRFFIPASNVKLLTTAASLRDLSPTFRIRTSVYGTYSPNGWKLRLVGRGDPSFGDRQLEDLAQQLKRRGIQRISELIVEDSYLGRDAVNSNWAVGDIQAAYAVPVNSLILNQNSLGLKVLPQALGQPLKVEWDNSTEAIGWKIENRSRTVDAKAEEFVAVGRDLSQPILKVSGQLHVGSLPISDAVAIPNPGEYFLRRFVRSLSEAGMTVARSRVTDQPASNGIELAKIESPSLSELVKEANQNSNNLYAEVLLRMLGVQHPEMRGRTVLERGLAALTTELIRLGLDKTEIEITDGSGLTRQNWSTPAAFVKVLQAMSSQQPEGGSFRDSLSIAGVSGTLQGRFQASPAKGIARAKTGTLTGVTALSGYIDPPNYSPIAFSIMINQALDVATVQRNAIDEIVGLLARLRSC